MRNFSRFSITIAFSVWLFAGVQILTAHGQTNIGNSVGAEHNLDGYDSAPPLNVTGLMSRAFHTANNPAVIDLAWESAGDNVGVTGYTLERSANPDFTSPTVFSLGSVTTFRDKTVRPATTYYWRIKAEDAAGNRSAQWTTLAEATLPAPVVNKQIIIEGDSLSTGAYLPGWILFTTIHSRQSWAFKLGELLDGTWRVRDVAFDGGRMTDDITADRARQITSYRKPSYERDIVFLWAGSNDIYGVQSQGRYHIAPPDVYKAMAAYVDACQTDGFEVWIMSTPRRAPDVTDYNKERIAFNNLLRADNSFADKFFDIDAWAEFQSTANATYYQKDKTHPTAAAHQVIANRVYAELVTSPLTITAATPLPPGTQGAAYSQAITGAGGKGAKTVSLVKGALPAGLNLIKGTVQGTPTGLGTFTFTLEVRDSLGTSVNRAYSLTISQ